MHIEIVEQQVVLAPPTWQQRARLTISNKQQPIAHRLIPNSNTTLKLRLYVSSRKCAAKL
jgi:hypothetical protein